ncbi:hypothetical protein CHH80_21925 [Bacillus sp. 7504-2]|nr:hypothetical protein CHH80_21925 [Bacillus sp. 7504-2]
MMHSSSSSYFSILPGIILLVQEMWKMWEGGIKNRRKRKQDLVKKFEVLSVNYFAALAASIAAS